MVLVGASAQQSFRNPNAGTDHSQPTHLNLYLNKDWEKGFLFFGRKGRGKRECTKRVNCDTAFRIKKGGVGIAFACIVAARHPETIQNGEKQVKKGCEDVQEEVRIVSKKNQPTQ